MIAVKDVDSLKKAVRDFEFYSKPSSGNGSDTATVEDINRVVKNAAAVLKAIVQELENS